MRSVATVLGGALLLGACERTLPSPLEMGSPDPAEFLLLVPDHGFRLTDAERQRLPPVIDPDSLETLLARIRPEYRATILTDFTEVGSQGPVAFGPLTTSVSDPAFRAALAAVFRVPDTDRLSPAGRRF